MNNRVTLETFYRQTSFYLQRRYSDLFEFNAMASSGKRINLPSDDPVRAIAAHGSHRLLEEVDQYAANVGYTRDWLKAGESAMHNMIEVLTMTKERAEQMATGTYSSEQRRMTATDAQNFLDQLISLGNTQVGSDYIFSGTRTNLAAVSDFIDAENPATIVGTHTTEGRLYGQGTYTGRLTRDVSLTVEAIAGNSVDVSYSYYDDWGRLVTGQVTIDDRGTGYGVDIGDGVQIYADEETFAVGERFVLEVGRHRGNREDLYGNLSWANRMNYNYVLDELFRVEGYSGTSVWEAVADPWNDPQATALLTVGGNDALLDTLELEINIGGPFQTNQTDDDLLATRDYQFQILGSFNGVPSVASPMTVGYSYVDGVGVTQSTVFTITGTGRENAVLLEPPGEGTTFYLADAAFAATGTTLPFYTWPDRATPGVTGTTMMLTYSYFDTVSGLRQFSTIGVTSTTMTYTLSPPGGVTLEFNAEGTFDDHNSWKIEKRISGGQHLNALDILADWVDALDKDTRVRPVDGDYFFEPMAAVTNHPASAGQMQITGDWGSYVIEDPDNPGSTIKKYQDGIDYWDDLKKWDIEFSVGGPMGTSQTSIGLLTTRNYLFTVDAGYPGGVPSADNPMVVNYTFNAGSGSVVITGTGPEYAVNLRPPGEGTDLWVADGAFTAGTSLGFMTFDADADVSGANPMPLTYTWEDDSGMRQYGTVNITDMTQSISLDLVGDPQDDVTFDFTSDADFNLSDRFRFSLEQYYRGQEASQKMLPLVESLEANLLRYNSDAGGKLNRLDVRDNLLQDDQLRLYDRLAANEDADIAEVISKMQLYQTLYQAALSTTALISGRNLADYI